ncbi:uncharacterized protein LOC141653391 isoform X2 [Silene latifolia]|uniref:uncharacterized protein LOC141653391 isoform X2 n=1 Tax=Silene latifolia TaxID=37657 RepID=UPI003D7765E7
MEKAPSLVNLCAVSLRNYILYGDDDNGILQGVYELPTELFDCLLNQLPALALHKLQSQMPIEKQSEFYEYDCSGTGGGRKRVRCGKFDLAWKALYYLRWPENDEYSQEKLLVKKIELENETLCDWQQKYWEMHVQNCFDAAAETAMLPSFSQRIGLIELPGALIKAIGYEQRAKCSNRDYYTLDTHCKEFGYYVRLFIDSCRCLRLQNVFFSVETCHLIARSKLKTLILKRMSSQLHVDGVCKILCQHKENIEFLEFANCKISSSFVEAMCQTLTVKGTEMHVIKHFAVKSSKFLEANPASLSPMLLTFISSRFLETLELSDAHIGRNCAKLIFSTLIDASSALSTLDLSDNNISGWLSDFRCEVSNKDSAFRDISKCLQSLRVLNLRGNNLRKSDMDDLRFALAHMPVLEELDLADNPIEDDGVKSLIPYFVETVEHGPLSNLNLKNCELSFDGATGLLDVLVALKYPMTFLSLADNDLGSRIAPALGDFLCTSIRFLDIRDIGLGSTGFLELKIHMPNVVNLTYINISENRGGIQAAEFLEDLISRAQELLVVRAGYNLMPPESLNVICSALDNRKDLMGNHKLCGSKHASILAEIQRNGGPTMLVQSSPSQEAAYDDDP